MLRRCFPFAPTVAAFAHAPLQCTAALTSPVSRKVGIATASCLESLRYCSSWGSFGSNKFILFTRAVPTKEMESRATLEETLKENLALLSDLTYNPSYDFEEVQRLLDRVVSWFHFIATHPLKTQEDLGKIRAAGGLAMLYERYISNDDCPPHLLAKAQELVRILSTPIKISDGYYYINQLITSVEEGEDPYSALAVAEEVFLSTYDLAQRQKAAKLYAVALEAIRKKQCDSLKATLKKEPSEEQREIVEKLRATVEALRFAPDPENPDDCIRFRLSIPSR